MGANHKSIASIYERGLVPAIFAPWAAILIEQAALQLIPSHLESLVAGMAEQGNEGTSHNTYGRMGAMHCVQ